MTAFVVRGFVSATDNAGILEVARTLAIPARVRLGIDRSPDFTAFNRAVGETCEIVVAEAAGRIIGFLEICAGRFRLFGTPSIGVHVPLAGVRPEWRRRGVLNALRAEGFRRARAAGAQWACILVNANNHLMQDSLRRFYPASVILNRLLVHGILARWAPLRGLRERSHRIAPLDESTWPELRDFMSARTRPLDVVLHPDAAKLRSLPDCPPDAYLVARDRTGQIVACLGSWDASAFKRALILGYGRAEHALRRPVNFLLAHAGAPPFPPAGEPLRTRYALCPLAAPGHEAALGRMIDRLRRGHTDCNAILLALPHGDPRNHLINRFAHFTNVNLPFFIPLTTECEAAIRSRPPRTIHLEYAFL
jgi:ribosomal protein S18 acetylase RimI-like enzyme